MTALTAKPASLEPKLKRLAKRKDGIYYAFAFVIAVVALAVALVGLIK